MTEIQEKAIRIALKCYADSCMNEGDFIDLLKAIFDKDLTNKFNFNSGFVEPRPKLTTSITDTNINKIENAQSNKIVDVLCNSKTNI